MSIPEARFPRAVQESRETGWPSKFKPGPSTQFNKVVTVLFAVIAVIFLAAAGAAALWGAANRQPLGGALALILLGLCVSMLYEAKAVWPEREPESKTDDRLRTLSQIAHEAFMAHQSTWVGVYLGITFIVGLLTMHFTRLAQNQQADWVFLGTTLLVLVNGALIAYWFDWLP